MRVNVICCFHPWFKYIFKTITSVFFPSKGTGPVLFKILKKVAFLLSLQETVFRQRDTTRGMLEDNNLIERSYWQKWNRFETDLVQNVANTCCPCKKINKKNPCSHSVALRGINRGNAAVQQWWLRQNQNNFGSHKSNIDHACVKDNAHSESSVTAE